MKLIYFSAVFSILLFSYKESEVTSQALHPYYGGPVSYSNNNNDDDDIGILLTILLLAAKNRGNSCCNCNCANNIPIPYPIPFPTNNPIITRYHKPANDDEAGADKTERPGQQINTVTGNSDNDQGVNNSAGASSTAEDDDNNSTSSTSGAISNVT